MIRQMILRTTPRVTLICLRHASHVRPLVQIGTRALMSTVASTDVTSGVQDKLKRIIEEYRIANYTQTTPSRFIKTLLDGIDRNNDGVISIAEVDAFLKNIGAEDKMSSEEIEEILSEWGCDCDDMYEIDPGVPLDTIKFIYLGKDE